MHEADQKCLQNFNRETRRERISCVDVGENGRSQRVIGV
jgi:hypothetical protein